jgi:signal transduction histidine kinase
MPIALNDPVGARRNPATTDRTASRFGPRRGPQIVLALVEADVTPRGKSKATCPQEGFAAVPLADGPGAGRSFEQPPSPAKARRDQMSASQARPKKDSALQIVQELNQPLTAILANAQAALQWLENDADHRDEVMTAIGGVVGSVRQAAHNVRAAEEIVRATTSVPDDELDLIDVIEKLLRTLSLEFICRDIEVETDFGEGPVTIRAVRGQLEWIVASLAVFGIDAIAVTRGRGLRIRTRLSERHGILVSFESLDAALGPTFEPRALSFGSSMGLALSLCRSMIEMHGGQLWAAPNCPDGSLFSFTLPVCIPRR